MIGAGGAANTGAIVSLIVMIWDTDDVLPHKSVNVQVLVIMDGHVPAGALSVPATDPAASQLSV